MSFNLGNLANTITSAIKPISPIRIDTNMISQAVSGAIDSQFSGLPISLTSTLSDLANGGVKQVLATQFDKLTAPLNSALSQAGFGNLNSALNIQNSVMSVSSTGLGSMLNAKPNPLNEFANYTYHIRFSMSNEIQAYNNINRNNPNTNSISKVVIAESGVTAGFNITSLKSSVACNGNGSKRNMWTATSYEMIINEPLGLTLLDQIYNSARQLGIINHLRCPYFLEIWFNGYDEAGNILSSNLFYSLNRITIQNINAVSTHVGTTYTMSLIDDGAWGEMNAVSTPPATISIDAATLGEFFSQLEIKWNNMDGNINNDGIHRTTYKFVIPPEWKSWALRNPDIEKQNVRNAPMRAEIDAITGRTTITINRGQSVDTVVDFVVYLCQEAQKWITGESSPAPGAASLKAQGMVRYVTVYPKVEINTAYPQDPVTGDYIRTVTYLMIPTESVKTYTDMQTVKSVQNITTQQSKFQYLISNNRLAKKYQYIYTGQNTEVLKFDFSLSNMWNIYQPTWIQSNSYDQYTQGAVSDTNSIGYQLIKGLLNRTQLSPSGIVNLLDNIAGNGITNALSSVSTNLLEAEQKITSQFNSAVTKLTSGLNLNLAAPNTSSDASSLFGKLLTSNLNAGDITKNIVSNTGLLNTVQRNTQILTTRQRDLSTKFAEDAQPEKPLSMLPIVGQFDPRPTQQQARQNADQNKIPSNPDPNSFAIGTGLVGSIISNIFSDDAFQNIEIEIRGDPWWIPIGNILQNTLADKMVGSQQLAAIQQMESTATFLGGDNEVLFEFRTGVKIDEDTGLAVTNASGADFFTGLYTVSNIENNFVRGKFTQVLRCMRDALATDAPAAGSTTTSRDRQDVKPPAQSFGPGTVPVGSLPRQSVGPGTVPVGSLPTSIPTDRR